MAVVDRAPYGPDGSLLRVGTDAHEWRPNEPFRATLTLSTDERASTGNHVVWRDSRGRRYPMFLSDLLTVLAYSTVSRKVTIGWWVVTKRNNHYGICPLRTTGNAPH